MTANHWQTKENAELLRQLGLYHGLTRLNSVMRYSKNTFSDGTNESDVNTIGQSAPRTGPLPQKGQFRTPLTNIEFRIARAVPSPLTISLAKRTTIPARIAAAVAPECPPTSITRAPARTRACRMRGQTLIIKRRPASLFSRKASGVPSWFNARQPKTAPFRMRMNCNSANA